MINYDGMLALLTSCIGVFAIKIYNKEIVPMTFGSGVTGYVLI